MKLKKFYRICDDDQQGLWYSPGGEFVGRIHKEFNFCKNCNLKMDFYPALVGYLSATESYELLMQWFDEEDIKNLQKFGLHVYEYESSDYWWSEKFQHWGINKFSSVAVKKIILL